MLDRLKRAFEQSVALYRIGLGEDLAKPVQLLLVESAGLRASVGTSSGGQQALEVGTGTLRLIDVFVTKLLPSPLWTESRGPPLDEGSDRMAYLEALRDLSLQWLILHELMHLRLEHPALLGTAMLVEVEGDDQHVAEPPRVTDLLRDLSPEHRSRMRPCLELQADCDATDVLCGPYRAANWTDLRLKAAAIMVMMVLIEKQNAHARVKGISHPKASTRLFQLMGQLTQFWLMENAFVERRETGSFITSDASKGPDLFERYKREVITPAGLDAVVIAGAAGLRETVAETSDSEGLFADIMTAQQNVPIRPEMMKTTGARQWAELLSANEAIMMATQQRQWG